jgi:hypothetical protein
MRQTGQRSVERFGSLCSNVDICLSRVQPVGGLNAKAKAGSSFVDLGADGIAIIDLMEDSPLGFLAPRKDKIVGVDDGSFPVTERH